MDSAFCSALFTTMHSPLFTLSVGLPSNSEPGCAEILVRICLAIFLVEKIVLGNFSSHLSSFFLPTYSPFVMIYCDRVTGLEPLAGCVRLLRAHLYKDL